MRVLTVVDYLDGAAMSCADHRQLQVDLDERGRGCPKVDAYWARDTLRRLSLEPALGQRIGMWLLHEPILYHNLRRIRIARNFLRGIRIE